MKVMQEAFVNITPIRIEQIVVSMKFSSNLK